MRCYDNDLTGPVGNKMPVQGVMHAEVLLGESLKTRDEFLIVSGLSPDLLLGLGFLVENNCVVDTMQKQLVVNCSSETCKLDMKITDRRDPVEVVEFTESIHKSLTSFGNREQPGEVEDFQENWIDQVAGLQRVPNDSPTLSHTESDEETEPGDEDSTIEYLVKGHQLDRDRCLIMDESTSEHGQTSSETNIRDEVEEILKLTAPQLTKPSTREKLRLVERYREAFALENDHLGCTTLAEHKIQTGETRPIKKAAHRVAPAKIPEIRKELDKMLEKGVIVPSESPYSSPIVMVGKKDGSNRMCIDFRALNEVTVKDAYPIPRIGQTLDALEGASVFSSLDLASGYWQVPLAPNDRHKTAFVTPDGGLYEFVKMPFGLCNAPATFQRLMNEIFKHILYKFVLIFLDDVLVFSQNEDQHLQHLEETFVLLRKANLKLKPKKCCFFQSEVSYLGHVINADGTKPDPLKKEAVKTWQKPKTVTRVRSFLGFCSYYRRFVKGFAEIAKPLHELTSKNKRLRNKQI